MEKAVKLYLSEAKHSLANEDYGKAYAFYLLVLKLMPLLQNEVSEEFGFAWKKWSKELFRLGRTDDLFSMYEQGCDVFSTSEALHLHMGRCLFQLDLKLEAVGLFRKVLVVNEHCFEALTCLENACRGLVDSWHFAMLNDTKRNKCFEVAIQQALESMDWDDCILDIGSGTGLLSMLAVRHGAAKVYAFEMSKVMHHIASECVVENNMSPRIKLKHIDSVKLSLGESHDPLPQKASLVISEIVDAGLLGEGIVETLNHAWNDLLLSPCDGGQVVPHSATVYCILVECFDVWKKHSCVNHGIPKLLLTSGVLQDIDNVKDSCAMDSDVSNLYRTVKTCDVEPYTSEDMKKLSHRILSEPSKLMDINFNDPGLLKKIVEGKFGDISCDFHNLSAGYLDAVIFWFELNIDSDKTCVIETVIGSEFCWDQAVYPVRMLDLCKVSDGAAETKDMKVRPRAERLYVQETDIIRANFSVQLDRFQMESVDKMNFCQQNAISYPQTVSVACAQSDKMVCDLHIMVHEDYISRMNDNLFNDSYFHAVSKHCQLVSDVILLDICSGFDLLVYKLYKKIAPKLKIHKFSTAQSVCEAHSELSQLTATDVTVIKDIPCSPVYDVVISDVIEPSGLLSPQSLRNIAFAKLCLKETGIVIPDKVRVIIQAINSSELLTKCMVVSDKNTLDLKIASTVNDFRVSWHSDLDVHSLNYHALSEKAVALSFDFNQSDSSKGSTESLKQSIVLKTTCQGILHAILFWFEVDVDAGNCLDTSDCDNHWKQAAYVLPQSKWLNLCNEDEIVVTTSCHEDLLLFSVSKYGA